MSFGTAGFGQPYFGQGPLGINVAVIGHAVPDVICLVLADVGTIRSRPDPLTIDAHADVQKVDQS